MGGLLKNKEWNGFYKPYLLSEYASNINVFWITI